MDTKFGSDIREMCTQVRELVSADAKPPINESHKVTGTALKRLEERLAELPGDQQDIARYVMYEELLIKIMEFHTVIDVFVNKIALDDNALWSCGQRHMEDILA